MYAALWRHLPGPLAARLAVALLLLLGILAVLWFVVFPFVDARYSLSPGTVG